MAKGYPRLVSLSMPLSDHLEAARETLRWSRVILRSSEGAVKEMREHTNLARERIEATFELLKKPWNWLWPSAG
jgi:hypothetical protein